MQVAYSFKMPDSLLDSKYNGNDRKSLVRETVETSQDIGHSGNPKTVSEGTERDLTIKYHLSSQVYAYCKCVQSSSKHNICSFGVTKYLQCNHVKTRE